MSQNKDFKCERCLMPFSSKQRYNSHINRIKKCEPSPHADPIAFEEKLLAIKYNNSDVPMCKYCKKTFSKKFYLERHLESVNTRCYIERNIEHEKGATIINHINNISNCINNNIIPIMLYEHGKESIKHVTKDMMLKMLEQPSFIKFCVDLMKVTYFDRKVPKNNNWFIAYPKNDKAGIQFNHETYQFERKPTIDIIDDKFSNMLDLFQPLIEEIYKEDEETQNLTHMQRMNVRKYYGYFGVMQISKESPDIYNAIHDLAYNMRVVPMTTFKELGLDAKYLSIKF